MKDLYIFNDKIDASKSCFFVKNNRLTVKIFHSHVFSTPCSICKNKSFYFLFTITLKNYYFKLKYF